jgi:hypothetical protein
MVFGFVDCFDHSLLDGPPSSAKMLMVKYDHIQHEGNRSVKIPIRSLSVVSSDSDWFRSSYLKLSNLLNSKYRHLLIN